jgi:hypothetical protein
MQEEVFFFEPRNSGTLTSINKALEVERIEQNMKSPLIHSAEGTLVKDVFQA